MSAKDNETQAAPTLKTLPGDDVRQIMWGFSDRFDLQMVVQSTRSVARGIVARLVANGARNSHDWTEEKNQLLTAFDDSGITSVFIDPQYGGYLEGPKNMALALTALELSWVDAGAATCSLATNLALAPIHERGTEEQKKTYFARCVPQSGKKTWRGAFALTEPLPYVGVDTGMLSGKMRVAEWKDGKEPVIHVEKRGRFITNMPFANFVTAAVESDDPKIKGSCMVILEDGDEGTFDPGAPTLKMVHQLSATSDPILNLKVPASRIIGGYTIKDGVIIPNFNHGEVIEAVFLRTRVAPGIMTAAKLLSAVEPVMRYQRQRFRGGDAQPGTPRYDLGLQQKEDSLLRLVDVWATGEAGAALGFQTALLMDEFDPVEKEKDRIFAKQGIAGPRAQMKALAAAQQNAIEQIRVEAQPEGDRDTKRLEELRKDTLTQYVLSQSVINVVCPATKLWVTGFGATQMREALSLVGGYAITEDCPGFLMHKWMDAQLEATYEGPESVQRRQLAVTMTNPVFLEQLKAWTKELREMGARKPQTGTCMLAAAFELWTFTLNYLVNGKDANGKPLYHNKRQGTSFPMADALSWLLAARALVLSVLELEEKGPENANIADSIDGIVQFYTDLAHVQCARAAGEAGKVCAELVFGFLRHPEWTDEGVYQIHDLKGMEGVAPGICSSTKDAIGSAGNEKPAKAGPCVSFRGIEDFLLLRQKVDGCLAGSSLAKDRAAQALTQVMIPEALDYPV